MASPPSQKTLGASIPYQPSPSQSQPALIQNPVIESSSKPCNSFHLFSSLPAEIRHIIWKLSFTPRTICLHTYQRLSPRIFHPSWYKLSKEQQRIRRKEDFEVDAQLANLSVSFKSTVITPSMNPSAAFHAWATLAVADPKKAATKPCPGPSALYVCQESRTLAKQAYTLAFPGTNLGLQGENLDQWEKNNLASPKIWVDFKNDLIFLDGFYRVGLTHKCAPLNPIGLLHTYANEETKKIERLAIGTSTAVSLVALFRRTRPDVNRNLRLMIQQHRPSGHHIRTLLCPFERLREIFIDDVILERPHDRPDFNLTFRTSPNPYFIPEGVNSIRDAIAREFEVEGANCPEQWPTGIPEIKRWNEKHRTVK